MERNSINGPGTHFFDVSLVRAFRFNGNHRIEARIESFNLLNWFQWNNPVSNFNDVNFGRITSAGDPRIMVTKEMTLDEVKAARPTADYDTEYGKTPGWTSDQFIEAVYKSLGGGRTPPRAPARQRK